MRSYTVPAGMIAAATERRLAGDWRGACTAAGMAVELDLADIARVHGGEVAALVEDDLLHLVPDLLRWYLPRADGHPHQLTTYGGVPLTVCPGTGKALVVRPPDRDAGPQRLTLRFERPSPGDLADRGLYASRELWDDRHTTELLARYGGRTRLPFFTADGRRHAGSGPEGVLEQVLAGLPTMRHRLDMPDAVAAFDRAGFDVDVDSFHSDFDEGILGGLARRALPGLDTLPGRAAVVAATAGTGTVQFFEYLRQVFVEINLVSGPRPLVRLIRPRAGEHQRMPLVPRPAVQCPEDLALLRAGKLQPRHLHPLIGAALFPELDTPTGPPPPRLPSPVPVVCGGETHEVVLRDGDLITQHPPEEIRREVTLRALGGAPLTGCAGAWEAWRWKVPREKRQLPAELKAFRNDMFLRLLHGDDAGLTALLDAGLDPHLHDPAGRTLLHLLPWLPTLDIQLSMLRRLLDAGLDPSARDEHGRTAADEARHAGAAPGLIAAIEDATP